MRYLVRAKAKPGKEADLMQLMGLRTVAPRPRTSRPHPEYKIYPCLLHRVYITQSNQVWSADITYMPMQRGYMYLVAVLGKHSRYVLSWEVSNTLDSDFCLLAQERALQQGQPEIFNTDQSVRFTAKAFTARLEQAEIKISMDSKGRVMLLAPIYEQEFYDYSHGFRTGHTLPAGR